MARITRRALSALGIMLVLTYAVLPIDASARRARAPRPLTIFAAASMQTALDAIAALWAAGGNGRPTIVYASSANHARQIEQGAPADIFISADEQWADHLENAGLLVPGTRRNFVKNDLVLIAPADSKVELNIEKGFDLAGAIGNSRLAVCTIGSCPGGIYAQEALTNLGVWSQVENRLAQASNIRGALNLVALGEANLGIVYITDANAERRVRVVGVFPGWTHSPILYPAAVVKGSRHKNALPFVEFLSSPEAAKILIKEGFTIIPLK